MSVFSSMRKVCARSWESAKKSALSERLVSLWPLGNAGMSADGSRFPRRQMTVEGIRQEQAEHGIGARFEPVGGQVRPPVETVEPVGHVGVGHEQAPMAGGVRARERFVRSGIRYTHYVYYRQHFRIDRSR